jgi:hypothetical protein
MPAFVRFMNRLHATVGARRVYVDRVTMGKTLVPPAVYFLADLRPATTPEDRGTMALNAPQRRAWFRYFRAHVRGVQAVVTPDVGRQVPAFWAATFPHHRTVTLRLGPHRVRVLLR